MGMEFTGKALEVSRDYMSGKFRITFEVNEESAIRDQYDSINGIGKLTIRASKYREARSKDANAYFHVLVGKIADALTISKARCKNLLIGRYGQPELLEDGSELVYKTNAPEDYMLEQEYIHCRPIGCRTENGLETHFYKIYRGSHTYNTQEMSVLIDGTISEAKELGIETKTPDEIERMKALWNPGA